MLERLTPYNAIISKHPVFQLETRRLPSAASPGALAGVLRRRGLWLAVRIAAVWMFLAGVLYVFFGDTQATPLLRYFIDSALAGTLLIGMLGAFGGLYVDLVSITVSLDAISSEITSGRWTLLRLANLREAHFTLAKHALAQVKAWRAVSGVVGIRGAAVVLLAVALALNWVETQVNGNTNGLFILLVSLIVVAIPGAIFIIEPILRLRTMSAVGLLISSHNRNALTAPLAGFGVTLAIWIAQLLIISMLGCGVLGLFFPVLVLSSGLCGLPLMSAAPLIGLYAFYDLLKNYSLRRTALRLARLEA
ncbi:MAG: hypothetical protein SF162_15300 [bacterium]|nr:hypothetical protein [bacterium]